MRSFRLMALLAMCLMLLAAPVQAKTTITFWHGMGRTGLAEHAFID